MFSRKGNFFRWIRVSRVALCLALLALTVQGMNCSETTSGDIVSWMVSALAPTPAHADVPVANAGGNQAVIKDQLLAGSLALDGALSSDSDGDPLTFEWFGPFWGAGGAQPQVSIPEGDYTVSLAVHDGSNRSALATVQVAVQPCFSIAARAKRGKVQLTWTHIDGAERYDVYRATGNAPIFFVKIGDTTSTYSTYLDLTVQNETTYLYVVGAVNQGHGCFSNVAATHPTAVRTRGTVNYAPVIYSTPIAHGTVGVVYNYDVQAADPNTNSLSYSLTSAPGAMTIDPSTGLIAWTPQTEGVVSVTVVADDGAGGSDVQSYTIQVGSMPVLNQPPVANAGVDTEYTLPFDNTTMAVTLDASASEDVDGTIEAYYWTGDPDPLDQAISTVILSAGTHTFDLVVEDNDGDQSTPDSITVTINPAPNRPPVADAGGPYLGALGQPVNFDGTGSHDPDGDALTFQWNFGDGSAGTDATPVHAYTAVGDYTVGLTVTDSSDAAGTSTATVAIREENRPPVLDPMPMQQVDEGALLAAQVSATDPDNDPLVYTAENLPAGAHWDAPNRAFSWTPDYDQSGQYTVTFTATDPGDLTATQIWTIEVRNVNRAPILAEIADRHISETKTVSFAISGQDPDNDALTYWANNLPVGAIFDAATRNFSWTPGTDRAGTYQIAFGVSDDTLQDSQDVMIIVHEHDPNNAPAIDPIGPQNVDEGQLLTFTVSASDPNGDDLSIAVTALPAGAVMDPTADPHALQFIWAPEFDQAGHYPMQCEATDSTGLSDRLPVEITVNNVNRPPQIDPPGARRVAETHLLTLHVSGSDPDGDALTFSADNLPDGASFDAFSQDFNWTPSDTQAGAYTVTFRVSDGELEDTADAMIEVIEFDANASPVIDVIAYHEIEEGQVLTFDVTAIDPNDDPLTFAADMLPTGADFTATADPNRYTFDWTPDFVQAGAYTVNFTVTDIGGLADTLDVVIAVNNVNRSPSLDPVENQVVEEGQEMTLMLAGADPDDDLLTYGAEPMPEGAGIDPDTGLFAWTPSFEQAGTYTVTYFTSDGEFTDQQQATIEVFDVNRAPHLLTASLADAQIDQAYDVQVVAEDADADPLTFSIVQTDAGVSIDATTGQLSWTPTHADIGTYMTEIQVADGRGGTDTQTYALSVPDTIPPSVQLTAPTTAIPGSTFMAAVQAHDNVDLMPVILEGTHCEVSATAMPDQWSVTPSSGMPIGETITLTATAADTAGNQTQAVAVVVMTGVPDIEPPQISLTVPPVVTTGQTIRITAVVSDDVGVAEVRFFAGGGATPLCHHRRDEYFCTVHGNRSRRGSSAVYGNGCRY